MHQTMQGGKMENQIVCPLLFVEQRKKVCGEKGEKMRESERCKINCGMSGGGGGPTPSCLAIKGGNVQV